MAATTMAVPRSIWEYVHGFFPNSDLCNLSSQWLYHIKKSWLWLCELQV